MTITKDEFRSRFATEQGRLGLGYPHVDAAQASSVLADEAMLDATYQGWVRAQATMPAAQPTEPSGPTESPYGQPYGQPYGTRDAQPYGQAGGQPNGQPYGAQDGQPYGQPYGQPQGGQDGQPYEDPYGQQTQPGRGSYFSQPNGQPSAFGQQYGMRYQPRNPTPTSALVLAIIGIVAPFVLFGLHIVGTIGLFLGIAALRRALVLRRATPIGAPGRAVATTALVLAIIAIVLGGLSLLDFLVALA